MRRSFCVSASSHSLSVGYGYASFIRLSIAIKNPRPMSALTRVFGINHMTANCISPLAAKGLIAEYC